MPEPARRNIEVKARCPDPAAARAAAIQLGAMPIRTVRQEDVYFNVAQGRLKLRTVDDGAGGELIYYERPDSADDRHSAYDIVETFDAPQLRSVLSVALGVKIVVRKRRELLDWKRVRIHLDDVEGLGSFLELEAVVSSTHPEPRCYDKLRLLTETLRIDPSDRIASSYSDLLLAADR